MIRIEGLLYKEIFQHGPVLLLVALGLGFVQFLLLLGLAIAPRTITMLEAHVSFVRIFLPILGLALGHRLVVREYHGRTQRFLESLPVRRTEVFLTKFVTGFAVFATVALASLVAAALVAMFKEPITFPWIYAIFVRTEAFAFCLWSFFFTMGLLGRWRLPVYLAILGGLLFIGEGTDIELARFGPFALVGETLVLERLSLPWGDVFVTLALGLLIMGLGAVLALANEGSVAESLASAMSRREKIAVGVVLALALIIAEVADPQRDKEPFDFESDEVSRHGRVSVLHLDSRHRAAAEALAEHAERQVTGLLGALEYEGTPPKVFVVLRPTLSPSEYETVELDDDASILLRAHFVDPAFDRERFTAFLLERALEEVTDGRAAFEPHAWVRSGVAGYWASREGEPDLRRAAWWRTQRSPRYDALDRFRRTEERFGSGVAANLATSAAWTVAQEKGPERLLAFARAVLREPAPGIFAVIGERRDPVRARFFRLGGFADEAAFVDAWDRRLRRPVPVPRARAEVRVGAEEGALRTVRWNVSFEPGAEPGAFCSLVHAPLGPFDAVLDPGELSREERPCDSLEAEGERLLGRYSRGDRVFLAVEVESPVLGDRLRLLAQRRELE